jgi:antitoxin (DNA-binding transcriptional repressor) of toxin-antitoxin stability system
MSIPIEQARASLGDLVIAAMHGESTTITRYGQAVAQLGPIARVKEFTLVIATPQDEIDGVDLYSPESPVKWDVLPEAAKDWANEQADISDDDAVFVLNQFAAPPAGRPTCVVVMQ